MKIVAIDTERLVKKLLPWYLVKDKMVAWLTCLLEPLKTINTELLAFRAFVSKEIKLNGQTIILEKLLNERVPNSGNTIVIINQGFKPAKIYTRYRSELQQPIYTYFRSEAQPPVFTFFRNEFVGGFDFIVRIPSAAFVDIDLIRAILDKYKLATKTYKIEVV